MIIEKNICPEIPLHRVPSASHLSEFEISFFKDTWSLMYTKSHCIADSWASQNYRISIAFPLVVLSFVYSQNIKC